MDTTSNNILLMPKLQFRFRVTFTSFGSATGTDSSSSLSLTRQVMDVQRPNLQFDEITIPIYNSTVYLSGKYKWNPITIKIRDDSLGQASKAIGDQLSKQMDFQQMASARSGVDYKFTTIIDVLDGNNGAMAPGVLEQWQLFGCFLTGANYDNLNYGTNDAATISLNIRFDNAYQMSPDGTGTLGSESFKQSIAGDNVNS